MLHHQERMEEMGNNLNLVAAAERGDINVSALIWSGQQYKNITIMRVLFYLNIWMSCAQIHQTIHPFGHSLVRQTGDTAWNTNWHWDYFRWSHTVLFSVSPDGKLHYLYLHTNMYTCEQRVQQWLRNGAHPDDCKNSVSFSLLIVRLRVSARVRLIMVIATHDMSIWQGEAIVL